VEVWRCLRVWGLVGSGVHACVCVCMSEECTCVLKLCTLHALETESFAQAW